jgi:hypothetical protein
MAVNKGFGIDFSGFLDLAEEISEKYNDEWLLYAAEQALEKTRKYVNGEIYKAMLGSPFSFLAGDGYSQGKAMDSFNKVADMPTETIGTTVTAYAGFDMEEAPEALILATFGAPHRAADTKLQAAIKVKGKVKKEVERIQKSVFDTVLNGGIVRDD